MKMWPLVRPKWIVFLGIFLLGIGTISTIVTGNVMGRFMGLLSAPLEDELFQKPQIGYQENEHSFLDEHQAPEFEHKQSNHLLKSLTSLRSPVSAYNPQLN